MRAPRQTPLQQWATIKQHESAIIEQLEKGQTLKKLLPKYGITPAYYHKFKSPAIQAAVAVSMNVKKMHARNGSKTINQ